jgi:hypothetical protein
VRLTLLVGTPNLTKGQIAKVNEPASSVSQRMMKDGQGHLSVENSIEDIVSHPAFAGFGSLILPWDDRNADDNLRLRDIKRLLPYHSEVNPFEIVASLNRMIDDANCGNTIFYDFYTDAQKQAEATKRNTGLFFFCGKPGAPFAIMCPGGGFSYVASLHEGFPYAAEISKSGYNAFVLKYRAGLGGGAARQDLAAAISYVLRNAKTLGVGVSSYSLWGSSAGARMAALIGSHGAAFLRGCLASKSISCCDGLHGAFRGFA